MTNIARYAKEIADKCRCDAVGIYESLFGNYPNRFHVEYTLKGDERLVYDGECPKSIEDAYRVSIEKWIEIIRHGPYIDDNGMRTCGLCLFARFQCQRCPIYADTKAISCENTPYSDYRWSGSVERKEESAFDEFIYLVVLYCKNNGIPVENVFGRVLDITRSKP